MDQDELAEQVRVLPSSVLSKVRMFGKGHGNRVRDCLLCSSNSNSADPILGERCILLWGHLDEDGCTILDYIDWYCVGVMRRRWVG